MFCNLENDVEVVSSTPRTLDMNIIRKRKYYHYFPARRIALKISPQKVSVWKVRAMTSHEVLLVLNLVILVSWRVSDHFQWLCYQL